jgi:ketosteroid isomerase-like protein
MSDTIHTLLTRNLFEVFGERNDAHRREVIKQLFTDDVVFEDQHGSHAGLEDLDRAVVALHKQLPTFVFSARGPTQALTNAGRLEWGFGLAGEPPRITGVDFIFVREGRISQLYTFLDPIREARKEFHRE